MKGKRDRKSPAAESETSLRRSLFPLAGLILVVLVLSTGGLLLVLALRSLVLVLALGSLILALRIIIVLHEVHLLTRD